MIRYFQTSNSFVIPGVLTAATIDLGTYLMQSPCSLRSVTFNFRMIVGGYKDIMASANVVPAGFKWFFPNSNLYTSGAGSIESPQIFVGNSSQRGLAKVEFEPGAMPITAGGTFQTTIFAYSTFAAGDTIAATVMFGIEFPDSGKAVTAGDGKIVLPSKVFLKEH